MAKYADRFNEAYLHNMGRVVASIVAALRDEHPDVAETMDMALGHMSAIAEQFPTGGPSSEVHELHQLSHP